MIKPAFAALALVALGYVVFLLCRLAWAVAALLRILRHHPEMTLQDAAWRYADRRNAR